jgi:hypothetical protein
MSAAEDNAGTGGRLVGGVCREITRLGPDRTEVDNVNVVGVRVLS